MKTRSLPKAPCDGESCPNGCNGGGGSDKGKLLTSFKEHKENSVEKKTSYVPSPVLERAAKNDTLEPHSGIYYSQPDLSVSIKSNSDLIEMFDLTNSDAILVDELIDDPDGEFFRGKDRSYSQLSEMMKEVSHYQGLDLTLLDKQTPKPEVSSDCLSETKSVEYQTLDSPPYQSIDLYQKSYFTDSSSNEYLEPELEAKPTSDDYQHMNPGYVNPGKMSYPHSKRYQYLNGDPPLTFGGDENTNEEHYKQPSKMDVSALNKTHNYEVSDEDDYQNDYVSSYLDLTAPDEEINSINNESTIATA